MTPRERAESLVETVAVGDGRYAVRWRGHGVFLYPGDDFAAAEARRRVAVDVLTDAIAEATGVTVQGKRYRIDNGPECWDQPTVRLLDAAFVAGMTLLLGLICGVLFGVYLPHAVWRALWPF